MKDPKNSQAVDPEVPQEPVSDGFPKEKDVSQPPEGSDQSDHPDKKR